VTSQGMPTKLGKTPLLQAIFEIRFTPLVPAAGDILLGLLYNSLKSEYPEVLPLPMASIPRQLREQEPNLQFQASHRLSSGNTSIQVGDRVASLSTTRYPGWNTFRPKAVALMKSLTETGIVGAVDRFSFRFINVIEATERENQLAFLNARFEIFGRTLVERGFQVRIELEESGLTTVVQIATRTTAQSPTGHQVSGLLIDMDTIREDPPLEFTATPDGFLEEAHSILKRDFYSLITEATLKRLAPEW
jgi:uncharacterized protein (TIGR04255 family)